MDFPALNIGDYPAQADPRRLFAAAYPMLFGVSEPHGLCQWGNRDSQACRQEFQQIVGCGFQRTGALQLRKSPAPGRLSRLTVARRESRALLFRKRDASITHIQRITYFFDDELLVAGVIETGKKAPQQTHAVV
jgi:hypothetical protein